MFAWMCVCALHVYSAWSGQRRTLGLHELELQIAWVTVEVLEIESLPSGRAAGALLSYWGISPVPRCFLECHRVSEKYWLLSHTRAVFSRRGNIYAHVGGYFINVTLLHCFHQHKCSVPGMFYQKLESCKYNSYPVDSSKIQLSFNRKQQTNQDFFTLCLKISGFLCRLQILLCYQVLTKLPQ